MNSSKRQVVIDVQIIEVAVFIATVAAMLCSAAVMVRVLT